MVMVDVDRFLSRRFRSKPEEKRVVKRTLTRPETIFMDKGFGSDPSHFWIRERGMWNVAPARKTCKRGRYREQFCGILNWRGKTAFWFARSCPKGTNATSGDFHEIPSLQYGRKNTHDFLLSR